MSKQVLKDREKSLCSKEIRARTYEDKGETTAPSPQIHPGTEDNVESFF